METFSLQWSGHPQWASSSLSSLFSDPAMADITLLSHDLATFKAHRVILSAASPLLASISSLSPRQSDPILFLKGVTKETLALVVQFIYQGQVEVPAHQVDAFLETAQEFQIQGLEKKAEGDEMTEGVEDAEEENVQEKTEYERTGGPAKPQQKMESSSLVGAVKKRKYQVGPQEKCPYCDKMFSRKGWIKNHISTVHSEIAAYAKESNLQDTIDETESQEQCPLCDQMFSKAQGWLKYHISAMHSKVEDVSNEEGVTSKDSLKDAPLMETDAEDEVGSLSAERPGERISMTQDEENEYDDENYDPIIDDEDDPSENIDTGSGPLEEEDKSEINNIFNEIDSLVRESKKLEENGGKKILTDFTEDDESLSLLQDDSLTESENKYVCQYCQRGFSKLGGLNRHGEKLHLEEWEKVVANVMANKNRVLENCLYCSKQFSTSAWMKKHVESSHSEMLEYSTESETEEKYIQEKPEEKWNPIKALEKDKNDEDIEDDITSPSYDEVIEFDYDEDDMEKDDTGFEEEGEMEKDKENKFTDQEKTVPNEEFAEDGETMEMEQKDVEEDGKTMEDVEEPGKAKETEAFGIDMTSDMIFENKFEYQGKTMEDEENEFGDEGETMDDEEQQLEDEAKAMDGFNDKGESIENEDNRIDMLGDKGDETKDWVDNLEKELQAEENNLKDRGETTVEDEMDITSDKDIDTYDWANSLDKQIKPEKENESLGNALVDVGRNIFGITIMKATAKQDKEEHIPKEEEEKTENKENVPVDLIEFDYSEVLVESKVKVGPDSNKAKRKITQVPRVECSKCGKTFTTKFTLEMHTKSVHLGIKEHCLFCDMTFSQVTNMRTHMKKHHSEEWTKHKAFNMDKVEC